MISFTIQNLTLTASRPSQDDHNILDVVFCNSQTPLRKFLFWSTNFQAGSEAVYRLPDIQVETVLPTFRMETMLENVNNENDKNQIYRITAQSIYWISNTNYI